MNRSKTPSSDRDGELLGPRPAAQGVRSGGPEPDSWVETIEAKARIIHCELLAARELAVRLGKDPDLISAPYFELLARLYRDEFPYALLPDHADLAACSKTDTPP
jgi:hypothetical protein